MTIKAKTWEPKVFDHTPTDVKGKPIGPLQISYTGTVTFTAESEDELYRLQEFLKNSSYMTSCILTMQAQAGLLEAIRPEKGL